MQATKAPLTVSQLNRQVRNWLEEDLGEVTVVGEVSNLSRPSSGHLYFTLKDKMAQLKCVYFRNYQNLVHKECKDGQQMIARGKLSLYEARGDYQLIVQELVHAGLGELYIKFEELKKKLEQLGLFAAERKKPLPRFPLVIAVITSQSGAAFQDILITLKRRFPIAEVHLYPCEVQGKTAARQLKNALIQANQDQKADVILLARGGGSIEDLWAFNDEQLALAIAHSKIPVISGVGHETDFTIADFVADWRAATPTAAVAAATPDRIELHQFIMDLSQRMEQALIRNLKQNQLLLSHLLGKLSSPRQVIASHWQTVDYLERCLTHHSLRCIRQHHHRLEKLFLLLQARNPLTGLKAAEEKLKQLTRDLTEALFRKISQLKLEFSHQIAALNALSPLATLQRGYAIATIREQIIFTPAQVNKGDEIHLQIAQGKLCCQVLSKEHDHA